MRFAAPSDVSGITLSTGPLTVVETPEGRFVEVPDEASEGDRGGLAVNGFIADPEDAPKAGRGSKSTKAGETPPPGNPETPPAE